ncbi:hypothetical protein BKE30_01835 [Alkanindiges hydrocarboniclasticus]|uniref:Methyltransferase type 11 domain-containing protein n=1 Tax=Alkanindiges hydrocarboniclasticus TaxID=1907941 RepID=A0A1S8CXV6_9GAMM|nr:methyltransferase domain-containing protein [Alkanindiges hydrocarboniclasticus]ONG42029.1 hypothetical protein BKE30_01835 [Alkanindiges hydrocarboniclasticus]
MDTPIWHKFNAAADQYDQVSVLQQQSARHLLDWMGAVLADSVWLDAGCGTGVLAKTLAAQGARVWAIDLAPNMLKALEDDDRIQTILADISQLPLADEMLDGAVSNFALHWLGSAIVPEILRVIQPGGEAWLAVPVAGSLSEVAIRYPGFPLFQFEPAQAWLEQASTCVIKHETRRFSQEFASLKALMAAIRQMGGDQTGQPKPTQSLSGQDLSRWKQWLQDQSPIALSFEVLFLHLKKPASEHALAFLYTH